MNHQKAIVHCHVTYVPRHNSCAPIVTSACSAEYCVMCRPIAYENNNDIRRTSEGKGSLRCIIGATFVLFWNDDIKHVIFFKTCNFQPAFFILIIWHSVYFLTRDATQSAASPGHGHGKSSVRNVDVDFSSLGYSPVHSYAPGKSCILHQHELLLLLVRCHLKYVWFTEFAIFCGETENGHSICTSNTMDENKHTSWCRQKRFPGAKMLLKCACDRRSAPDPAGKAYMAKLQLHGKTPCSWNAGLNGAVAGMLKMQEWKKQERQRMESRKKRTEKKSRAYKIPTTWAVHDRLLW